MTVIGIKKAKNVHAHTFQSDFYSYWWDKRVVNLEYKNISTTLILRIFIFVKVSDHFKILRYSY